MNCSTSEYIKNESLVFFSGHFEYNNIKFFWLKISLYGRRDELSFVFSF